MAIFYTKYKINADDKSDENDSMVLIRTIRKAIINGDESSCNHIIDNSKS